MPTLRLESIAKIYKGKHRQTAAILNIDLTVNQGEFVFLVGSRGAGKSTLLDIISGDVEPDRGAVYLDEVNLNQVTRRQSAKLRSCIGRVSQDSQLNRSATVYQNLLPPKRLSLFARRPVDDSQLRKALALVGLPGYEERCPIELSLSQCRRVEIAKAIVHSPSILLLDGITDRVDDDTTWDLLHLLGELNARGTTILMATNASTVVNVMRKRVVTLADGKIVGDVQKGRYGYIR